MRWEQIFDDAGRESQVAKQYGIASIPYNLLLDGNGKVVEVDLRGPQLRKAIATLLENSP